MIKERIKKAARELGLEKVGFSENAVVVLFPYFVKGESGNISLYARSLDYHRIGEAKLGRLSETLRELGAEKTEIYVDKGGLDDRKAAYLAGLGFWGRNGMLICEELGSYFFIGQIVHDLALEPDAPLEQECLGCGKCERECPAGALSAGRVDVDRCLSAVTQKKGELTAEEEALLRRNGFCWGCDACQSVCPHNSELGNTAISEFLEERRAVLKKTDIDGLSNREFKEKYGKYAFSWRGKGVLLRNLEILEREER